MIDRCVVCRSHECLPLFDVASAPIHPFCPPAALGLKPGFGELRIVSCATCGHIFNAAFDADRIDDLYAAMVLTNTPVSESMIQNLESTADYILAHAPSNPVVADVGGGTGVLSRTLARRAREVHLIEPSRALDPAHFAGTGVTLHQSTFPAPTLGDRVFDVIVSRQVVEHIPDPAPFLAAVRSRLADRGVAYLEIPSAEYIERTRSIVDFHYPHVHYYRRGHFEALLARAGFRVIEAIDIKEGHDQGFLLSAQEPDRTVAAPVAHPDGLREELACRVNLGRERLRAFRGPIALYGANAYSQALMGLYPAEARYAVMFDDTPLYEGQHAYGPGVEMTIERPRADRLGNVDAVVITSYLHDIVIARKVRDLGFQGPVFTVRADSLAGAGGRPPGLFHA